MKDNEFFIYGLYETNDINEKILYYGSCRNMKQRKWLYNKKAFRDNAKAPVYKWIRSLSNGFDMKFIKMGTKEDEAELIKQNASPELLNIYFNPYRGFSEEHIQNKKIATSGENNPFWGRTHTENSRKKISESRKGITAGENHPLWNKGHSEEAKNLISISRKRNFALKSGIPDELLDFYIFEATNKERIKLRNKYRKLKDTDNSSSNILKGDSSDTTTTNESNAA